MGVQETEGVGGGRRGRFKRCMGRERNWGIYATMLSISQQKKVMRCSHVNTEGNGNARYGGGCLAPPYPSFPSLFL